MREYIFITLLLFTGSLYAQENDSTSLKAPAEGKSMLYIARRSGTGPLIKFGIYDGDKPLGKLGVNRYFAYECEPGTHVFAARSENTSYVEANLAAGRIYVLDAEVKMGIAYARVALRPLEKGHKNYEKEKGRFLKFIANKKGEQLGVADDEPEDIGERNTEGNILKKYHNLKEKGKKIAQLAADMYIEP